MQVHIRLKVQIELRSVAGNSGYMCHTGMYAFVCIIYMRLYVHVCMCLHVCMCIKNYKCDISMYVSVCACVYSVCTCLLAMTRPIHTP